MEYLENSIKRLLSEARQLEIKIANIKIKREECYCQDYSSDHLIDEENDTMPLFQEIVKSIYLSTLCYLDKQGLKEYIKIFYKIFGRDPEKPNYCDEFNLDDPWSRESYSEFLFKIKKFLSSFEFMESNKEQYERLIGLQYLETILNNTAAIIAKNKLNPRSEAEVYKQVKPILECIFAGSKSPKSNFFKIAKEYKPDILIPELYAAIEYKYAKNEQKLKSTIEQIAADVKGYTGDNDYKIFYAVFYVTNDFWGKDKFQEIWNEQKFPKNWNPIYIVGK